MPYKTEWVEPELFLEHNGVKIWRSYKENDLESPLFYWFVTNIMDTDEHAFDVRELPEWPQVEDNDELVRVQATLRAAIESGRLTNSDGG